jgi:hypothetical protein
MRYTCPACGWIGERKGKPWPCPKCKVGDKKFPLLELKDGLVIGDESSPVRLKCEGCGNIGLLELWLENEERCPKCKSSKCHVLVRPTKEPERLVQAERSEEDISNTRKVEVDAMVQACRPVLEHYGETGREVLEEVVEDIVASLREILDYWHNKTFAGLF